tara:strand:+ start:1903 stop:3189 length:1287 start_codon:yes stop_codon:yes gene_type:complete
MNNESDINITKVPEVKVSKKSIVSWALYDLANTLFSFNIVSIHFALWVVNDMGGTDSHWGIANAVSMMLVLFTAPFLGAMSDQTKKRIPFLTVTTLLCVMFTFALGQGGLSTSLVIFIAANYMFNVGLVFYDALLPSVSTESNRGKIGAFGVGLGYVGSLIGAISGMFLLEEIGRTGIFKFTAILFLIFALPCFFLVKDQATEKVKIGFYTITNSVHQLRNTLSHVKDFPGLPRFLIGRVFYADAVNTSIIFMGIYVSNELGFSDDEVQMLLAFAVVSAIIGASFWGFVVDAIGPKRSLNIVLFLWVIVLIGICAIPLFNLTNTLMWPISALAGIAMGGIWCADRPFLIRLVPPQYVGEFFGVYSMTGRFASIVGPLIWVFVAETMGLGRPVAVLSMLVLVVISYFILRGVEDTPHDWQQNILEDDSN